MISELDTVVLKKNCPEHGLRADDVGTVVHSYAEAAVFEVEFVDADGRTVAVLTLGEADIRPMSGPEILHVRGLAS